MSAECGDVLISGDQSLICTIAALLWRPPLLSPCLSAPVSVRGKTTAAAAALPTLLPWPPATSHPAPLKVQQRTLCGEKAGKYPDPDPGVAQYWRELFYDSVPGKFTACGQFLHISIWMPKPNYCSESVGPDDACS